MNRAITTSAIGASVLLAASGIAWWVRRGAPTLELPPTVIPMVSPIITVEVAEQVLSHMEHLPSDEVTLVLHTDGGEVTGACSSPTLCESSGSRPRSSRTWRSPAGR